MTLSRSFQASYASFAAFLDPNKIKGAPNWSQYESGSEKVLVFQTPDANGVGIHTEHDQEDTDACRYIDTQNTAFIR
jgi:carboxylesterase type B